MGPTSALTLLALLLPAPGVQHMSSPNIKRATTCFKSGEQTSGMNKICYYNCLGSQAAITISAVALCPLTIDQ
jgi:hypothetical protein